MRAHTADIDRMLLPVLASAPSLNDMIPLDAQLVTNSPPDSRRCCSSGVHDPPPPRVLFCRCFFQAFLPLLVNDLVCKPSKELKAAGCPVVRTDNLLGKNEGIDTDDAEDSAVKPLPPMFGGKIAVHLQYPNLWRSWYSGRGPASAPSLGLSPGQYTSLFCNLRAARDRLYQGGRGSGNSLRDVIEH